MNKHNILGEIVSQTINDDLYWIERLIEGRTISTAGTAR